MWLIATTSSGKSGSSYIILIYLLIFGAFYFFYMRPRAKKQKAQRAQQRVVDVGDQVRTIGGMIGTVVSKDANSVTLQTLGGQQIEFIPSAIAGRHVPPGADESTTDDSSEGHDGSTGGDAQ